jgi:5-(carboxyamino)imidazole ribonucleotide synthase
MGPGATGRLDPRNHPEPSARKAVPEFAWAPGHAPRCGGGPGDLEAALAAFGRPAIFKTAAWGYDGRGQVALGEDGAGEEEVRALLQQGPGVLEAWVDFELECSVLVARGLDGRVECFGPVRNEHRNHILDVSSSPAGLPAEVEARARTIAETVAREIDLVGVLCVEYFCLPDGRLLVNELAPRPHNSGHLTIEGSTASQFEQQVRAVCGLPLSAMEPVAPAAMANLLGDLWEHGDPAWTELLALPGVELHLYGKREARARRKMGPRDRPRPHRRRRPPGGDRGPTATHRPSFPLIGGTCHWRLVSAMIRVPSEEER